MAEGKDLVEAVKSTVIDSGIVAGFFGVATATFPTLPLTYSLARHYISPEMTPSLVTSSEVGRISLLAGLGLSVYTGVTRQYRPAAVAFAASSALGFANVVAGKVVDARLS